MYCLLYSGRKLFSIKEEVLKTEYFKIAVFILHIAIAIITLLMT